MSDPSNTAQASTDAGAGQAATDQGKVGADAQLSLLAGAGAADAKADAAANGTATADKPEGDKAADPAKDAKDGDKSKDGDKAKGVPEKYELKMPEGMTLDQAALDAATPVFKELGLSSEQAQKLADVYASRMSGIMQQQREAWQKQHEGWVSTMKADPEFGGDKFDANLNGPIVKAIDTVMGKDAKAFREALSVTGMGNHPEMARFLYRVGKMAGEGSMIRGDAAAPGQNLPPEQVLYTSMQKGK